MMRTEAVTRETSRLKKEAASNLNPEKTFKTGEEVNAYFFPKGRKDSRQLSGQDQGTELAQNAFAEISESVTEGQ
jgi:hypothetical protein